MKINVFFRVKRLVGMMAVLAVVSLLVAFAGPDERVKKMIGKWSYAAVSDDMKEWQKARRDNVIEFKKDNVVVIYSYGEELVAQWFVKGDELIMMIDTGVYSDSIVSTIVSVTDQEFVLYDRDVERYEKYKRVE